MNKAFGFYGMFVDEALSWLQQIHRGTYHPVRHRGKADRGNLTLTFRITCMLTGMARAVELLTLELYQCCYSFLVWLV